MRNKMNTQYLELSTSMTSTLVVKWHQVVRRGNQLIATGVIRGGEVWHGSSAFQGAGWPCQAAITPELATKLERILGESFEGDFDVQWVMHTYGCEMVSLVPTLEWAEEVDRLDQARRERASEAIAAKIVEVAHYVVKKHHESGLLYLYDNESEQVVKVGTSEADLWEAIK